MRNNILIALTIVILLYSCNAVRQVLSDPAKKEIVGREWAKQNPCINDSVISFQPGDTIVTNEYHEDTLYYFVNDTIKLPYGLNKIQTITRVIHDSTKVAIRDTRAEKILKDSVDQYLGKMKMYKEDADANKVAAAAAKKKLFWWKFVLYAAISLAVIYKFRFNILSLVKHLIPVTIP